MERIRCIGKRQIGGVRACFSVSCGDNSNKPRFSLRHLFALYFLFPLYKIPQYSSLPFSPQIKPFPSHSSFLPNQLQP